MVGIIDIARETGLSKTTVSYILNGDYRKMNIKEETAGKVRQAAALLGYQPNYWAKALAGQKSNLIGVLLPDLVGSFAQQIIKGVISELEPQNYEAFLGVSFWDDARERREMKLLLGKKVNGIIALPHSANYKAYEEIIDDGCPLVFISDYLSLRGAAAVTLDVEDAVGKMIDHLTGEGYDSIVMLGVNYASNTLEEREKAFTAAMFARGLPAIVLHSELADASSVAEQVRLITQMQPRPQAIFCESDTLAHMVLGILAEIKIRVPEDLAVAGLGNTEMSVHPLISLTTVGEPLEEMGRAAVRLIMQAPAETSSVVSPQRVQGELYVRRSTVRNHQLFSGDEGTTLSQSS